jgi:uncharacterized membrane protein
MSFCTCIKHSCTHGHELGVLDLVGDGVFIVYYSILVNPLSLVPLLSNIVTFSYPGSYVQYDILIFILFVYLPVSKEVIGDEGAVRIAEGLDMNTSLKELCLSRVFLPPYVPFTFLL